MQVNTPGAEVLFILRIGQRPAARCFPAVLQSSCRVLLHLSLKLDPTRSAFSAKSWSFGLLERVARFHHNVSISTVIPASRAIDWRRRPRSARSPSASDSDVEFGRGDHAIGCECGERHLRPLIPRSLLDRIASVFLALLLLSACI